MGEQKRDDVELNEVMKRLLPGERISHDQLCEVLNVNPAADHHVVAKETLRRGCGLFVTQTDGFWWIDRAPWGGLATNTCPLCGHQCEGKSFNADGVEVDEFGLTKQDWEDARRFR